MMEDMYLGGYGLENARWERYVHYINAVDAASAV